MSKRRIWMLLLVAAVTFVAAPVFAMAQTPGVDPAKVKAILELTFIPGGAFTIIGLTEIVKRLFWKNEATRPKWSGYVVSIALSIVATAVFFLVVSPPFVFLTFAVYAFFVALGANGLYQAF